MVDVSLTVLAFTLIAASSGQSRSASIPIDLPRLGETSTPSPPSQTTTLALDAEGKLTLQGEPVEWNGLGEKLQSHAEASRETLRLFADRTVPMELFLRCYRICQGAGYRKLQVEVSPE
jgi:biopolymer transport protein ExbD